MSDPFGDRPFPRGALIGAGALIGFTLLSITVARVSGVGFTSPPAAEAIERRELRFVDRSDGSVAVFQHDGDRPIEVLAPGTNGFIRGVMRGLARERRQWDIGTQPPFLLTRWADGRLTLEDPTTGRQIDLAAFGPTNAGAFARLLSIAHGSP